MRALAEAGHEVDGVEIGEPVDASGFDAAVDFTAPAAVRGNADALLAAGVPCVIGTTGLAEEASRARRARPGATGRRASWRRTSPSEPS